RRREKGGRRVEEDGHRVRPDVGDREVRKTVPVEVSRRERPREGADAEVSGRTETAIAIPQKDGDVPRLLVCDRDVQPAVRVEVCDDDRPGPESGRERGRRPESS